MKEEIVNRVAKNTKLQVIDLEDYYPEGRRVVFDLSDWLFEGLLLKEQDFRASAVAHDWSQYQNAYVALTCSSEAIIPGWAYMLICLHLAAFTKKVVVGTLEQLEAAIFQEIITATDFSAFRDKFIIIKGCSKKPVPQNAYVELSQKLQPIARSIMYGEACSSVPLYKKSNP
jgi:ABC-type transport system involved in cytochrome bd biosynthesis fused ATPase/permease subunit